MIEKFTVPTPDGGARWMIKTPCCGSKQYLFEDERLQCFMCGADLSPEPAPTPVVEVLDPTRYRMSRYWS